jgi:hypothetical protein
MSYINPTRLADVPAWARAYKAGDFAPYAYTADILGFSVDQAAGLLNGLFIRRGQEPFSGLEAWPGGFVEWATDVNAEAAATRELREETGQTGVHYMEALDTYDTNGRDPRQFAGFFDGAQQWVPTGARVVSKAFVAVVRHDDAMPVAPGAGEDSSEAFRRDVYAYLPWEDLRAAAGRAALRVARQHLQAWAKDTEDTALRRSRRKNIDLLFRAESWNEERAPERLALLGEAALLHESHRDQWGRAPALALPAQLGRPLAFDHRVMLADALGRIRGKMKYAPVILATLIGDVVTSSSLHVACEAIAGRPIHRANLRRAFDTAELLVDHGFATAAAGPGRPPREYRWSQNVASVRLDPSLHIPWQALSAA